MNDSWVHTMFWNPSTFVFLIPIVAIICGSITAIVKMVLRHRERIEMIRQGIDPDYQPRGESEKT
jgi:hypothetical protein